MQKNTQNEFQARHLINDLKDYIQLYPLQLLLLIITFTLGNSLLSILSVDGASWRNALSGSIGVLFDVSIAMTVLVLLSRQMHEFENKSLMILDVIKSKILKYFVTNIIVAVVIAGALMVMSLILASLMLFVKKDFGFEVGFIPILLASLYFHVKYAMILQMIVFEDIYYMRALNYSSRYVKKHLGVVIAIQVLPIAISFVPGYIAPKIAFLSSNWGVVSTNFLHGMVYILSIIALTILFKHIEDQENSEQVSIPAL